MASSVFQIFAFLAIIVCSAMAQGACPGIPGLVEITPCATDDPNHPCQDVIDMQMSGSLQDPNSCVCCGTQAVYEEYVRENNPKTRNLCPVNFPIPSAPCDNTKPKGQQCQQGLQETWSEDGTTSCVCCTNCEDRNAETCAKNKKFCVDPKFHGYMKKQCAKTCGFCVPNNVVCQDSPTSPCKTYMKNGFCDSSYYTQELKRRLCPVTCGLC